jgi:rhamnogalacturonan endolyase
MKRKSTLSLLFMCCLFGLNGQTSTRVYDISENFEKATSPWSFSSANQFSASITNAGSSYGNVLQLNFDAASGSRTTATTLTPSVTIPDNGKVYLDFDLQLGVPTNKNTSGIFFRFKDSSGNISIAFSMESTQGASGNALHLVNLDNTVTTDATAASTRIAPTGGSFSRNTWVSIHAVLNFITHTVDSLKITNGTAIYENNSGIAFYNASSSNLATLEVYANRDGGNLSWTGLVDNFSVYHQISLDKSTLESLISTVTAKINSANSRIGTEFLNYRQAQVNSLTTAKAVAETALANAATQAEIDSAVERLTGALNTFNSEGQVSPNTTLPYKIYTYGVNAGDGSSVKKTLYADGSSIKWSENNAIANSEWIITKTANGYTIRNNSLGTYLNGGGLAATAAEFTLPENRGQNVSTVGGVGTVDKRDDPYYLYGIQRGDGKALEVKADNAMGYVNAIYERYRHCFQFEPSEGGGGQSGNTFPPRQMEYLDRGLIAVKVSSGVFVSWRLLGTDADNSYFKLYRGSTLIHTTTTTGATNFTDVNGTTSSQYYVETYASDKKVETSKTVTPWGQQYLAINLQRPNGGTTPDGVEYTYTPNDCSVGDLDGDGEYEIVVKWDPSNSKDNSQSGYTGNVYLDAYKMNGTRLWRIDLGINIRAGAHYTQFMVYDLDGDGIAEVACKTAPGTIDGEGCNVLMSGDNANADYRNTNGYILSGPEYLTVFNGNTGGQSVTIAYKPDRGTVSNWGDNYGNRVDRFLATVAYLDGEHPSLVMCRGYYTRAALAAYDYRKSGSTATLTQRWIHDSQTAGAGAYGQGNHNLSVADVDGDGKDEIIYGSCAIDDNGTLLYRTGLGHGDAMHVSDLLPNRPGLEVWAVHEEKDKDYGYELHDARTGEILWGAKTGTDVGRGLAADINPNYCGFEMWSSEASAGTVNITGNTNGTVTATKISETPPSTTNFRIYWDGDLQDELLDGDKLNDGDGTRLITFYNINNAAKINGTKNNPCLSADLLGDWREEVILYNSSNPAQIMIFTTTISTEHRLYTLMHDPVYRMGIAWQNVGYNQPPHLGFYIGGGSNCPCEIPKPNISTPISSTSPAKVMADIQAIDSSVKVFTADNHIVIKGIRQGTDYRVFNLMGNIVKQGVAGSTELKIALPSGVYLVKAGNQALKVIK